MLTIIFQERLLSLEYNPDMSIADLKKQVMAQLNLNLNTKIDIDLIHNNNKLENNLKIGDIIEDNSILHVSIVKQSNSLDLNKLSSMFPDLKKSMSENKEFKEIMKNGNLEDEINNLNTNPEYMKTQLKNVDLAMSKLENMPGGLNMMSSMIKQTEPLNDMFKKKQKEYKLGTNANQENKKDSKDTKKDFKDTLHVQSNIQNNQSNMQNIQNSYEVNWLLKYAIEIRELNTYGFCDLQRNVEVLKACDGDVEMAMLKLVEDVGTNTI